MINNTRNGDVVTSILTIDNVTLNDNGTEYLCFPSRGIESYIGATLVAGTYSMYVGMNICNCMYTHMHICIYVTFTIIMLHRCYIYIHTYICTYVRRTMYGLNFCRLRFSWFASNIVVKFYG